jgi:Leucine-rich repeat (LRR) protein
LKRLENEAFHNLHKLKYLSIAQNQIENLDSNVLGEAENLKYLDISNNFLCFVHKNLIDKMQNLDFLFASESNCIDKDFEITGNVSVIVEAHFNRCNRRCEN